MPEESAVKRAQEDAKEGKSALTQAGEFVREEIDHVREGVHGARSPEQAIAIGLSKARRAGVKLPPPKKGSASDRAIRQAQRDTAEAGSHRKVSRNRSRATSAALQREGHRAASPVELSDHARSSARRRGPADLHRAAMKAVRTKVHEGLSRAKKKAARPRNKVSEI